MRIEGMDAAVIQENIGNAVDELREARRIKRGVDYSYTLKYRCLHIMCNEVYKESVKEVFDNYDLPATYLTWGGS
jgi:hypothetical protein